jgi:hypothetical protein
MMRRSAKSNPAASIRAVWPALTVGRGVGVGIGTGAVVGAGGGVEKEGSETLRLQARAAKASSAVKIKLLRLTIKTLKPILVSINCHKPIRNGH